MVSQLSPPSPAVHENSKYVVRSVVGEVVYRTNCAGEAMRALVRFLVKNPDTSAAIYRRTRKGWVIYSLYVCGGLLGG